MTSQRLSQILISRWVQGLLVAPKEKAGECFNCEWTRFACATMASSRPHQPFHRACHDFLHGMRTALSHAEKFGFRRIGYVTSSDLEERVNGNWFAGFAAYQAALGRSGPLPLFVPGAMLQAVPPFKRWLRSARPDVIITAYPNVMALIKEAGHRVPSDISVIHLDVDPEEATPFAGIDQRHRLIGAATVELIVEQIIHNTRGLSFVPKTIQLPGVWVDGNSVKPNRH